MKNIFITRRIPLIAKEILEKYFLVDMNDENLPLSKEKLQEAVSKYDAILSTITEKFDAQLLDNSKVEVISNYAVGLDNIDLSSAKKKGISVYNTPNAVTNSTADLTFALLLTLIRKTLESKEYVKEGKWSMWDPELLLGEELDGKTFGIIGFGRIGKAVAKRAIGFGLNVIFYDPKSLKNEEYKQASLDEVLENSDYISIHIPLNDNTKNFIDKEKIDKMKKKPIFLNLSRGKIVDTSALVNALREGTIRGACLDVSDPEPLPKDHVLLSFNNCIISPHIGTGTKECRNKMAIEAAENIVNHYKKSNQL